MVTVPFDNKWAEPAARSFFCLHIQMRLQGRSGSSLPRDSAQGHLQCGRSWVMPDTDSISPPECPGHSALLLCVLIHLKVEVSSRESHILLHLGTCTKDLPSNKHMFWFILPGLCVTWLPQLLSVDLAGFHCGSKSS